MTSEKMLPQLIGVILDEQVPLTLAELSRACAAQTELIIELVEEGVLAPIGREPQSWRFTGAHLRRARLAVRLQRDLEVNLAGAALALQLLDEIEALRTRLRAMGGECGGPRRRRESCRRSGNPCYFSG
jgi:chaperone modulatory protein CbpM